MICTKRCNENGREKQKEKENKQIIRNTVETL